MTTTVSAPPEADPRHGLFDDPLADWTNDDILLTKPARAVLGAHHLRGLKVLDWPELRAVFTRYDTPASREGRRDRRLGMASITCAAAGVILAAFAPLAAGGGTVIGLLATLLALGGAGFATAHWLDRRSRARWLGNRFWTERVRALYFQTIVNNLGLVAGAMRDDRALGQWRMLRARALEALPSLGDVSGQIHRLAGPVDDNDAWILPEWTAPPALPEPSEELEVLLSRLRSQRFDSQLAYTDRKLGDSLNAPRRRSQAVRLGNDVLPIAAVGAATVAGLLLLSGSTTDDVWVKLALAIAASATAAGLAVRLLNDSLRLSEDATRYAWYGAAVLRARTRFDTGDIGEKLAALREMETIVFRDIREFVAAHWRAR